MEDDVDPRARRTRAAILGAFTALALSRRYDAIRTADLVAAAGVGRSTFYAHFRSKDEVLVAAVQPILHVLASAALGRASPAQVRATLDHVWEQRAVARLLFEGRTGDKLQLAMLRLWLRGEAACPAAELAERMITCGRLLPDRR